MDYEQTRIPQSAQAVIATEAAPGQELHELTPNPRAAQAHTALQPGDEAVQQATATAAAEPLIERPAIVYLDDAITIKGMKVHYTRDGARYLRQHWLHIYNTMADKLTNKPEIKRMLENYDQTLQLYSYE